MHYVYILKSGKDGRIYIGFTKDLRKRLFQHNDGQSEYTSRYRPWKLIYYEAYLAELDANGREKQLKRFAKAYGQLKGRIKFSLNEG